ncbi:unnamed protein product [Nesidiocoris tenuis]|uniref:Intraflagellar transport protein 80 homolog n=1 Tax=Nesidiocoris tenuis TaxID=355587 RepID=A0A6H5GJK1_9HEMI|nr:unnamed protein product [Nesidiocoris tenuis]CAB0003041.1 unnamed protein product [Nesidiocoris tenuis]
MQLKLSFPNDAGHQDTVTCVSWNNSEEVYTCGDDHALKKWNLLTTDSQKICDFSEDVYPLDLHCFSRNTNVRKPGQDQMIIASSDGKCHLLGKSGRIEKSVEAHKGAVLVAQWAFDGASFLTCGEDGQVKVWSRSGMLRTVPVQASGVPIYSACWGPDSNHLLYTQGKHLVIKSLLPNVKPHRWKAHDGLILKVAWEQINGRIVSGGEDGRYKVWDSFGALVFNSMLHEHPITSIAWAPNGEMFAIGSFNTLRLCDKSGWSHYLEKPETGSLYSIAWSADGTQLAAGCANRQVLLAHVIGRRVEWGALDAKTTRRKTVVISNAVQSDSDILEFPERVIHLALAYKHLVVVTTTQCYVHNVNIVNTPVIIDLREGSVSMVLLAEKHMVLVERSSLAVYSYDGRLISSPKWPSLNPSSLNPSQISLGPDCIAARDQADEKGSIVQSFKWNSHLNMIAAIQDTSLTLWYYPYILFVDKKLVRKTTVIKDSSEFGHRPQVTTYVGNHVGIRRSDGALINSGVSPYVAILHGYSMAGAWKDALRLCRMVKDEALWACLAVMATQAKEIDTAESAYAAINQFDKVLYLQHIKEIKLKPVQMAEMSLLGGNVLEAEALLLQNGLIFRAIMTNINTHNWERWVHE